MRPPRRLTREEQALWRKLAETVTPLERRKARELPKPSPAPTVAETPQVPQPELEAALARAKSPTVKSDTRPPPPRARDDRTGLDGTWERRIGKGDLVPDFSLDLHGSTLDQAYSRLMHGLAQARARGARVVLVVTGKPRPAESADRGSARGAIRAKIVDWLGASEHSGSIAAIRTAHRRHGGAGALYVVLKKRR